MKKVYNIAIVGGGPGGVASAVEAVILGIDDVILLEKGENHSTTIRKFYKDNKRVDKDYKGQKVELNGNIYFVDGTKESTLDLFDEILNLHRIEERFNTEVESVVKKGELFLITTTQGDEVWAKFVIISIGKMGQPNKPSYEIPLALKDRVHFNVSDCKENEKILVVGGGNSAVEYAYFLADLNKVTLNYRKTTFTRVNEPNMALLNEYAQGGKLELRLGVDIVSLEEAEGKPKVNFSDGKSEMYDRVVYAIGGMAPMDFLRKCSLEVDEHGVPLTSETHEGSVSGIYIAGDILFKSGGSIAAALNHGFSIVQEIKKQLA
ncbi:NAD(P)-binding domain-containing protein [Wolinella succinogenes]|uniref:NAD(P)-binding domain-containing protein n=1 Tax=Wolinella succinogenes TaxID=844 RepID=UPI00240A0368|nr:NAD(P)-binding domain-containing protein [Wolinella succinogenes]